MIMAKPFHSCLVAGTHSGAGKTLWSLALMSLALKRGLDVQPFKAGPDYIDAGFHSLVCKPRKSRNLDLYLLPPGQVRHLFHKNAEGADLAVVEGVMGLFDGRTALSAEGSTAELARTLDLPVFLVLDAAQLATGAAAVVLGFQNFDPQVRLKGVFINRVNHEGHYQWLKQAIESKTGIPCLGYLPDDPALTIPERHLGLTTALEMPDIAARVRQAREFLELRFDWEKFLQAAQSVRPSARYMPLQPQAACRVAVAYDQAFSFYYEDNFDLLRGAGAEIVFFSPMKGETVPEGTHLLYLGGGFPEVHAEALAEKKNVLESIREFYASGGKIYAECGGFIYLTEGFTDSAGREYEFAGLVPGTIRMRNKLQNFGYHEIETAQDTFLCKSGVKLRSHEFHYSAWEVDAQAVRGKAAYKIGARLEGYADKRLMASYQHLHFASMPELITNLLDIDPVSGPLVHA